MPSGFDENSQVKKKKKMLDPEDFMDKNFCPLLGWAEAC